MAKSEDNKQLILGAYRAFATGERDEIAAYFAEDAEWIAPERNGTAVALGTRSGFSGRDAIVKNLAEDVGGRLFSGATVELLSVIADEQHVVVEQRFRRPCATAVPTGWSSASSSWSTIV